MVVPVLLASMLLLFLLPRQGYVPEGQAEAH
jgi:hypothetical protein